jgi:hypothetical protein
MLVAIHVQGANESEDGGSRFLQNVGITYKTTQCLDAEDCSLDM